MNQNNQMDLISTVNKLEIYPLNTEIDLSSYAVNKISLADINNLGIAFKPIVSVIQTVISGEGKSGLYYVNTFGKEMFKSKDTRHFLGGLKANTGAVGGGQAELTAFACDPTLLCLAAAVSIIEKKLEDIHERQKDILSFLEMKELSSLESSVETLNNIINDYKYHFDNQEYLKDKNILIQSTNKEALDGIKLWRKNIGFKMKKRTLIHNNIYSAQKIDEINFQMKNYQLSLYLWCYSAFLEV